MKTQGFTLIEMMLVIAIAAMIFLFSTPYGLTFYRTQLVEEMRSELIDALGRAKHNAVLQKNDSSFGVHIVAGNYIIFQGADYASRTTDQDEIFPVINEITFAGLSDVTFSKLEGLPSSVGLISVAYGDIVRNISVDDSGLVSKAD
jgi:prepilin-type N-terminal cleavage/methylation domain-containing protein